jgi:ribosomal protein S18 acetylase RimI-like enzyme
LKISFKRADVRKEIRSLLAFDRKAFAAYPGDWFEPADWESCEPWWMLLDGRKVGCCAFARHTPRRGSLFISTTGILPGLQGKGLGRLLKCWQIAFARHHGFKRIVTNTRSSNQKMIELNRKFGFKTLRKLPRYYSDPVEATVVMALDLRKTTSRRRLSVVQ